MTHEELKSIALQREGVKTAYDALEEEFSMLDNILQARHEAGLTQEQVAERMGTKRSAITRLESSLTNGKHSPSIATLRKYAEAMNYKLEIRFVQG